MRRRRKGETKKSAPPNLERSNVVFVACSRRSLSDASAQLPPQTTRTDSLLAIHAKKRASERFKERVSLRRSSRSFFSAAGQGCCCRKEQFLFFALSTTISSRRSRGLQIPLFRLKTSSSEPLMI